MVASIALVRAVSLIETRFANSTNVVDSNLNKITEYQNNVLRSDQKGCYTKAAQFNAAVVFCTSKEISNYTNKYDFFYNSQYFITKFTESNTNNNNIMRWDNI